MTRTYEGASVAVDPNDSDKVYLTAADLQDRSCHVFRSTDGGRTFSELKGPDFGVLTDCGLNRGGIPHNIT